jgi:hypothetical protein
MIRSGENYATIQTRTVRIEYWYGTTRRTVRYDTTRYDTIRTAGDRPTMQYIHVRQTPHSTYNLRFVLYFLGEYSTVWYEPRECRLQTEIFYLRSARSSARLFTIRSAVRTVISAWRNRIVDVTNWSRPNQDMTRSDTYLWNWLYLWPARSIMIFCPLPMWPITGNPG